MNEPTKSKANHHGEFRGAPGRGPRVLITGGTGFLGSHLLKRLVKEKYSVVLLKRPTSQLIRIQDEVSQISTWDLAPGSSLKNLFEENQFDLILHCATDYGRKALPPSSVIEANLLLPLQLLELAHAYKVPLFVNTDTILDKRTSYYSLSKRQFSDWLSMFSADLTGVNVALEHFYGPGDDHTKFVSKMVWSLVNGVDRIELTKGEQKRDFIFIDDVIDAFMAIIVHSQNLSHGFFRYEVGTQRSLDIKSFLLLLKKLSGNTLTELDFGALPYRENEVMDSVVDLKALTQLGWKPKVALEDGLARTIEFERQAARAKGK